MGRVGNQPPREYHRITKAGQRQLEAEVRAWQRTALAIGRAIESTSS